MRAESKRLAVYQERVISSLLKAGQCLELQHSAQLWSSQSQFVPQVHICELVAIRTEQDQAHNTGTQGGRLDKWQQSTQEAQLTPRSQFAAEAKQAMMQRFAAPGSAVQALPWASIFYQQQRGSLSVTLWLGDLRGLGTAGPRFHAVLCPGRYAASLHGCGGQEGYLHGSLAAQKCQRSSNQSHCWQSSAGFQCLMHFFILFYFILVLLVSL